MHTKIKVGPFAAKLRKRLAELKKKREADTKAYSANVVKWRVQMVAWVEANAKKRIDGITATELKRHENRYGRDSFDTGGFFAGAPSAPTYPTDAQIRKITGYLRHLGITGQDTVQISTDDVTELLGDDAEE